MLNLTPQQQTELKALTQGGYLKYSHLVKSSLASIAETIKDALGSDNPRQILFHIENNHAVIPKCGCGKDVSWHPDTRAYRVTCSRKCSGLYGKEKVVATNLEKYGVEHFTQTAQYVEKTRETSLEKHGVEHHTMTDSWKQKVKEVVQEKYGVDHVMHVESVKDQLKVTNNERYGGNSPFSSLVVKEKIKETNLEKYGFDHALKSPAIKLKKKATILSRYGVSHVYHNPLILAKSLATRQRNHYTEENLRKFQSPEYLTERQHVDKLTIGDIAKEINVSSSHLGKQFHKLGISILKHKKTSLERRLTEACEQFTTVVFGDRTILDGKEIDVWLPELNLGIEINGLYYHGEAYGKMADYHIGKTQLAKSKGIELWQFWDYELEDPRIWNIVLHRIKYRLQTTNKIAARKTTTRVVDHQTAKDFLELNHLQGWINAQHYVGLYHNDTLVSLMSFSKSRFTAKHTWELIRFASSQGVSVVGGASKLLAYFEKHYCQLGETIISYCDARYSDGNVYKQCGFAFVRWNKPGYFYSQRGEYAGSRYQFQKHLLANKLPIYNSQLTEEQNMKNNNYDMIWDCGQIVWTRKVK